MKMICLSALFFALLPAVNGQLLPPCMDTTGKPGTKPVVILSTVRLPNGQTVYKKAVKRPARCMDCASGVVYVDSLCQTVASFTIGIAPVAQVAAGYEPKWFPESSAPGYSQSLARANGPREYEVTAMVAATSPLAGLRAGDHIVLSKTEGLKHFRAKEMINQYKIIPQRVSMVNRPSCATDTCPAVTTTRDVFFLEPAGRYIVVEPGAKGISFRQTTGTVADGKPLQTFAAKDWEDVYLLRIIY
ncbi:MAG: hypothetical protein EOO05_14865 [Chitinophagaceae bacterium]|nr:MAG: hypothetical protein EOO05_14865 [Chitinophagaceae bacterium]